MKAVKNFVTAHPHLWEFLKFNLFSNCATIVNFITIWMGTTIIFKKFANIPFKFLVFNYVDHLDTNLGLCGFLSFLLATILAQIVNFFIQKNFVFKSNAEFQKAVPKYIMLSIVLVVISAAMPAYSQKFFIKLGILSELVPTLANVLNIFIQVVISYPVMKFWIMPKK